MDYGFRVGFLPFHRAPNQRMKLTCRSGHNWWNGFFLIVAAPAREAKLVLPKRVERFRIRDAGQRLPIAPGECAESAL